MVFDTNLIIQHVRRGQWLNSKAIIPVVVAGELRAFALKADWGTQKLTFLESILKGYPIVEITMFLTDVYAQIDAYSQGTLKLKPLPLGMSSRNMSKNDLWIATTALYFDLELHTTDNDFDHLSAFGLRLVKHSA
ncbi:tRNA(fMet)-specific endonuclease VapC [Larkinella arboricola]|uniref:tRNA(fMet)-specific endonuclease VapC n=1 Tax=Larkinella arboricola TaxID=643671 RepID=A0A327WJ27_LARAB|nr:PIN domain-containing protein [Larkinella arboricola]RAJ89772.1 tRNA(fMet)-specific endonuclease VapC [Larkinella arboricola]